MHRRRPGWPVEARQHPSTGGGPLRRPGAVHDAEVAGSAEHRRQSHVDYRIVLADSAEGLALFGPVTVLPTTWLIDHRGRVAATHVGLVDGSALEADIRQLLAE